MSHFLFVVEGVHDVEALGCLLRRRDFTRVKTIEDLDDYWEKLVPRTYPIRGDLLSRVSVPAFFTKPPDTAAICSAVGLEKILQVVQASLLGLPLAPQAVCIILDADTEKSPTTRWETLKNGLGEFDFGAQPGHVAGKDCRAGIYVIPDNQSPGTLEDILLECAEAAYPKLLAMATKFVDPIEATDTAIFLSASERQDFKAPAGKKKAKAGCISNILRPGKSIQVSIQDNRWLKDEKALALPRVASLQKFVDTLIAFHSPLPG